MNMKRNELSLVSDFTLCGIWWLPKNPSDTISGRLRYNYAKSITLELDGAFDSQEVIRSDAVAKPRLICGSTNEGKKIMLVDSVECSYKMHLPGKAISTYLSKYMFIGNEFFSLEETKLESVLLEFTNVSPWLKKCPLKVPPGILKNGRIDCKAQYNTPKIDSFFIKNIDASIRFESRLDSNISRTNLDWCHKDYIRITPKRKQYFSWYQSIISDLRSLLSIFIWDTIYPIKIEYCIRKRRSSILNGRYIRENIDMYYTQPDYIDMGELIPPKIPFPYAILKKDMKKILNNWFVKSEKFRSLYDLFIGVMYNKDTSLQFKFLALIQALESFHRAKGRDKYLSIGKYSKIEDCLKNAIPEGTLPDLKQSLKSRIKYGNEYSLRKRMTLIFKSLNKELRALISNDWKRFINEVVDTRNYLTHRDQAAKANALDLYGRFQACEKLKLLLLMILLIEIGLTKDHIYAVISNHPKLNKHYQLV